MNSLGGQPTTRRSTGWGFRSGLLAFPPDDGSGGDGGRLEPPMALRLRPENSAAGRNGRAPPLLLPTRRVTRPGTTHSLAPPPAGTGSTAARVPCAPRGPSQPPALPPRRPALPPRPPGLPSRAGGPRAPRRMDPAGGLQQAGVGGELTAVLIKLCDLPSPDSLSERHINGI